MVLTDEYSFNPDTQKINECITRINDLQPRYQARGFSIEATMQPFIFKYALKVIITRPEYNFTLTYDVENESNQFIDKLIAKFEYLPHILNRFHSFITELTTTYSLKTQSNFKLHMDPNNPETWIDFTLQKDYRKVDVTIGFNKQLAFIHTINLYSSLGEEQDSYQITIPGTTTQITVDGSSDYFHDMYANDSIYFEYGASNKKATDFITQFITTITHLNLETR